MPKNITHKICTGCEINKPLSEYGERGGKCRKCRNEYKKSRYYLRKKYFLEYQKNLTPEQKQKRKEKRRIYEQKNAEKQKQKNKEYRNKNRDKLNAKRRERKKNSLHLQILERLRIQVNRLIKSKGNKKSAKTIELLGCSIEEFMNYISVQFKPGMSWENYGYDTWHLDHKLPAHCFDLSKPEHQKICFHYTNLQPMWALDNMRKNKFILPEYVPYYLQIIQGNTKQLPKGRPKK